MSILPEDKIRPFGDAKSFVRTVRGFSDEARARVGFSYDRIRAAAESVDLGRVPFADTTAANQEQLLVAVFAAAAALVEDYEALRKDLDATRSYDGSPLDVVERMCEGGEPTLLLKVGHSSYADVCVESDGRIIPLTLATGAPDSVGIYSGLPTNDTNPKQARHCIDSVCGLPLPERANDYQRTFAPMWVAGINIYGTKPHSNILLINQRDLARCGVLLLDTRDGVLVYGYGAKAPQVRAHIYRRLGSVEIPPPSPWREAPIRPDVPAVYAYRWSRI